MTPPMLAENESLIRAGVAIVVLRPRDKRPRDANWTELPRWSWDEAQERFPANANIGIRLGQPSAIDEFFVYGIDLDIRSTDSRDIADAKAALRAIVGDVSDFACVRSGSGGESRHFYFLSDGLFRPKKLAHSKNKVLGRDGKLHWAWEIDLGGTGRQFVLPPSVHPLTREPYEWLYNPGIHQWPLFYAAEVESWLPAETRLSARENADQAGSLAEWLHKQPPRFAFNEIEDILDKLADSPDSHASYVEDREGWLKVGMALHNQFKGDEQGFELWCSFSAASDKFDLNDSETIWDSFGKTGASKNALTMRTLYMESKRAGLGDRYGFVDRDDSPEVATEDDFGLASLKSRKNGTAMLRFEQDSDVVSDLPPIPNEEIQSGLRQALAAARRAERASESKWKNELDLTDTDQVKSSPSNVALIVTHDERLKGMIALNSFNHNIVVRKTFPALTATMFELKLKDRVNGDLWTDAHDANLHLFFNSRVQGKAGGWGMKPAQNVLDNAIQSAAQNNSFHPVVNYLNRRSWDGVGRADTMFIDYLGCPDRPYYREVCRLMLIAAVTRVFEIGHKWDFAPILEGAEGKRKSTFIRILARSWFGELNSSFGDERKMVEKMQGKWILELPELTGMSKSEVGEVKHFMSTQEDLVRLAYAHRAESFPRQCIFIGSTNDGQYLASETGNRRFFPIACNIENIDTAKLSANIDQIWAEAVVMYRQMRADQPEGDLPLYLSDEAAADEAFRLQASRKIESAADIWAGRISDWLNTPTTISELIGDTSAKFSDNEPHYVRTKTCTAQIWQYLGEGRAQRTDLLDITTALRKLRGWAQYEAKGRLSFPGLGQQRAYVLIAADSFEVSRGYRKMERKKTRFSNPARS